MADSETHAQPETRHGIGVSPGKEPTGFVGDEGRRYEQPGGVVALGPLEDLRRRRVVAADQPAEQDLDVDGHGLTVLTGADGPLTATSPVQSGHAR